MTRVLKTILVLAFTFSISYAVDFSKVKFSDDPSSYYNVEKLTTMISKNVKQDVIVEKIGKVGDFTLFNVKLNENDIKFKPIYTYKNVLIQGLVLLNGKDYANEYAKEKYGNKKQMLAKSVLNIGLNPENFVEFKVGTGKDAEFILYLDQNCHYSRQLMAKLAKLTDNQIGNVTYKVVPFLFNPRFGDDKARKTAGIYEYKGKSFQKFAKDFADNKLMSQNSEFLADVRNNNVKFNGVVSGTPTVIDVLNKVQGGRTLPISTVKKVVSAVTPAKVKAKPKKTEPKNKSATAVQQCNG